MFQADVYKVMIGAPSDIQEEINIAINAIYHWNHIHAEKQKTMLLPLHWSISAYPAIGQHPQKVINQQVVNKSDLLICIFGAKLGTPTNDYVSGSVEEIEEHIKVGKPVMIFFKNILSLNDIDIEQVSRLREFKNAIGEKALYADYNDIDDFERILSDKLSLCVNDNFIKEKIVVNGLEWNEVEDGSSHGELSEYDKERLKSWTSVDDPEFFQLHFEGGGCIYGLGATNQYEIKNGREKIEWNSFFEKLLKLGLIEIKRYDKHGYPVYQLKESAYKYVKSHNL